jgi:hypothetical protein
MYDFQKNRNQEYSDVMTLITNETQENQKEFYGQVLDALAYYSLSKSRDFGLCAHFPFDYIYKSLFQRVLDCINYTSEDSAYKFACTAERIEFLEKMKAEISQILIIK